MIYRMSQDVAEILHARKFPVAVFYGKERVGRACAASAVVVFSRDRKAGDQIVDMIGSQRAPVRKSGVRMIGVTIEVFAQAHLSAARLCEHEAFCDKLVDGLQVAIQDWVGEAKSIGPIWSESRYLEDEEVDGAEHDNGAVYRLKFRIGRGVYSKDYEGNGPETATIAGVSTTIEVKRAASATIEEIDHGNTTPGD